MSKTEALIKSCAGDPLTILKKLGGYYECSKDASGNRLTPLVGYAAKYKTDDDEFQYVGEVYCNFAKAEEHPGVMAYFAEQLLANNVDILSPTEIMLWNKVKISGPLVFVGPQMGGIAVAQFLAYEASKYCDVRYACAEKIVTEAKSANRREQSTLEFARHTVNQGDNLIVCEDVLNNFSTTQQLIELAEKNGANVVAIVGLLNRSMTVENEYQAHTAYPAGYNIPVISLVRKPFAEYKQEDLYVIKDIVAGNLVPKPKNEWGKLARKE